MLECAMVCLLASSVGIKTSKNETACSYCIDARSSHENCFDNVIDCAYRDPHGIIFCTNFFETEVGEEFIQRQTRCISYYDLLISDDTIRGIVANGNCNYKDRQYCDCPATCPGRNITNGGWPFDVPTTTPKPPRFPKGDREKGEGISVTIKTPSQLVEEKQPRFGVSFIERAELYVKDMWGAIVSPASAENGEHGIGPSLSLIALIFGLLAA
ncbi:hypothetical protein PRIPAC_95970 [Pristionchus pacificus]|uniref:Uncharacterized protein n=1 Tax=Pristionchus pacificus TaxID=54126 RepID=A0A2A6CGX6_PRIPA|nr:hypothetical protein PRIPAC_95970 [Pristionchus pacificus]|eukprot:PDM77379.1 hypothetical protein PRIPAC_33109 [Pristionchus pacificus]